MGSSSGPDRFDIFEIYSRYRDIVSTNHGASSKELLIILSQSLEAKRQTRETIFSDIYKLMSCLNLSVDSRQFNCFYDFVFFICREHGQKNITVNRAIAAWRLVLNGRFRLLNQWCNFVERHQRHNISEDTWQQLLAFSQCVNEDLEGYDPKGAWPVLIDDFVEHMFRISESNNCGSQNFCGSSYMEPQPNISNTFSGLNLLPGSKRKTSADFHEHNEEPLKPSEISWFSDYLTKSKRPKYAFLSNKLGDFDPDLAMSIAECKSEQHDEMNKHGQLGCLHTSACVVEDSLSKGFEGYLSIGCCLQFDQKSRVST